MIDGEYSVRIVAADGLWDKSRVELHAAGNGTSLDFLGVDPSVQDMAMVEGGRPVMASHVAMAERAIILADSTRMYHDSLADEAERVLMGPEDELFVDEREIAELLGMKEPSWETLDINRIKASHLREVTIRRLCELRGVEVPSMDSPAYLELVETADKITDRTHEAWRKFGVGRYRK